MRGHRRILLDYFLQPRKRLYYESRGEKYKQHPSRLRTLSLPCIPEESEVEGLLSTNTRPCLAGASLSAPLLCDPCSRQDLPIDPLDSTSHSELLHHDAEEEGYAGHSFMLRVLDHNVCARSAALDEILGLDDATTLTQPVELQQHEFDLDTIRLMSYGGFGVVVNQPCEIAAPQIPPPSPPPTSPRSSPSPAISDVLSLIEVITHLEKQQTPATPAQQTKLAMLVSVFTSASWRNFGFVYSQALKENLVKPALRSKLLQTLKLLALQVLHNLAGAASNSITSLSKSGATARSISQLMALAQRSIVHE